MKNTIIIIILFSLMLPVAGMTKEKKNHSKKRNNAERKTSSVDQNEEIEKPKTEPVIYKFYFSNKKAVTR